MTMLRRIAASGASLLQHNLRASTCGISTSPWTEVARLISNTSNSSPSSPDEAHVIHGPNTDKAAHQPAHPQPPLLDSSGPVSPSEHATAGLDRLWLDFRR
ncbi:hypothetical protein Agub_g15686 [Astrephomene gubernaculifera]|uniref:Uncharacterized protein n=1 Tax=Astrephomene gubernaculifera TaxID=47775 RepID=A0AAD3E3E6_9CHLO|nr:hypothetical protein Agub_g15686 [Astrephomene gubernaculifera]